MVDVVVAAAAVVVVAAVVAFVAVVDNAAVASGDGIVGFVAPAIAAELNFPVAA